MSDTLTAQKMINHCVETSSPIASPQSSEVLAIIPARGGSKGIRHKNICTLGGLPLIAYTIRAARQSRLITRVIVSTDDPAVAEVARELGAEVPFMRPQSLATDTALLGSCADHALTELRAQGYVPDAMVVLYPTHPFRTPATLDHLAGKLLAGYSPVLTVKGVDPAAQRYARLDTDGTVRMLHPGTDPGDSTSLQYRGMGLFDGSLFRAGRNPYIHVVRNPISRIDIDTPRDLALAEEVIRLNLFDFSGGII
ncbi:MAG: acylneuraminate cytidylyltransferase family protein [Pseudomonadota bacterium]